MKLRNVTLSGVLSLILLNTGCNKKIQKSCNWKITIRLWQKIVQNLIK